MLAKIHLGLSYQGLQGWPGWLALRKMFELKVCHLPLLLLTHLSHCTSSFWRGRNGAVGPQSSVMFMGRSKQPLQP